MYMSRPIMEYLTTRIIPFGSWYARLPLGSSRRFYRRRFMGLVTPGPKQSPHHL